MKCAYGCKDNGYKPENIHFCICRISHEIVKEVLPPREKAFNLVKISRNHFFVLTLPLMYNTITDQFKTMRKIFILLTAFIALSAFQNADAKWRAKHVVFIGADGWGAYSVPKATGIPNIKSLMENGSYTLHKRSVFPTASAINWASMWNGCPTEIHSITEWNTRKPTTPLPEGTANERGMLPTVFSLLHEQYPKAVSAYIGWWDVIADLIDTTCINYKYMVKGKEASVMGVLNKTCEYIKQYKPAITFATLDEPDGVGHAIGHDTPAYYDSLKVIDKGIGKVIQATKDAGIYDETIFILTTDHGGVGRGHGARSLLEYEGPFIICGKNVKKLGEFKESMMQYDIAATTAYIFGLKTPQVWTGRPMKQVFAK